MAVGKSDLGILGDLAVALGIFTPGGSPNPDWFGDPEASLTAMLSNPAQRAALIAFVDAALGGADRSTEAGVTGCRWSISKTRHSASHSPSTRGSPMGCT